MLQEKYKPLGNKRSKSTILVSFLSNKISNFFHVFLSLGSKPKKQPKRERTEDHPIILDWAKGKQVVGFLFF
jgi:hypothetical protein